MMTVFLEKYRRQFYNLGASDRNFNRTRENFILKRVYWFTYFKSLGRNMLLQVRLHPAAEVIDQWPWTPPSPCHAFPFVL